MIRLKLAYNQAKNWLKHGWRLSETFFQGALIAHFIDPSHFSIACGIKS
jgi:hypothetical protein